MGEPAPQLRRAALPLAPRAVIADLEAELRVMTAIVVTPAGPEVARERAAAVLAVMSPEDMWDPQHRAGMRQVARMLGAGVAIGPLGVHQALVDAGEDAKDVRNWINRVTEGAYDAYWLRGAEKIAKLARQRRALDVARSVAAELEFPVDDLDAVVSRHQDQLGAAVGEKPGSTVQWISPLDLCAPQPPVPWVVPGLALCPGRPGLFGGVGYVGKSIVGASVMLAVAAKRAVWSTFPVHASGNVAWFDYELGRALTIRRFQRLANGLEIDLAEIAPQLRIASMPALRLTTQGAEDAFERAVDGCVMAFFDSARRAMPGVDENSSEITPYLDQLTRISERTGCTFVGLHHASTKVGAKDLPSRAALLRGSSAIFDAAGTVFVATRDEGEPAYVTCEKEPVGGAAPEPFYLGIEDVPHGDDPRGGLVVRYQTVPQIEEGKAVAARRFTSRNAATLEDAVLRVLADRPGCSLRQLRHEARALAGRGDDKAIDAARDELVRTRRIHVLKGGPGTSSAHHLGGGP